MYALLIVNLQIIQFEGHLSTRLFSVCPTNWPQIVATQWVSQLWASRAIRFCISTAHYAAKFIAACHTHFGHRKRAAVTECIAEHEVRNS